MNKHQGCGCGECKAIDAFNLAILAKQRAKEAALKGAGDE